MTGITIQSPVQTIQVSEKQNYNCDRIAKSTWLLLQKHWSNHFKELHLKNWNNQIYLTKNKCVKDEGIFDFLCMLDSFMIQTQDALSTKVESKEDSHLKKSLQLLICNQSNEEQCKGNDNVWTRRTVMDACTPKYDENQIPVQVNFSTLYL